jgi:hypothetical protein
MGELQPLRDDLPQPIAVLAAAMRELFASIDVSLTRYSARAHVDKSNVSRYLSGRTVPPWSFVHGLMVESTRARDGLEVPTVEVVRYLQELHAKAQAADGSPGGELTRLKDRLAQADLEVARVRRSERRIEGDLDEARRQVAELLVGQREIEARIDADRRAQRAEVAVYQSGMNDLTQDKARLLAQIAELAEELEIVQRKVVEAEEECASLERELDSAEQRAAKEKEELRTFALAQRKRAEELEKELEKIELGMRAQASGPSTEPVSRPHDATRQPQSWSELLMCMDSDRAGAVLLALDVEEAAQTLYEMSPYDAALALANVDRAIQVRILEQVPAAYRSMIWNRLRG